MTIGLGIGVSFGTHAPDASGGGTNPNAILDEDGNPILDEDGNQILDENA